MSRNAAHLSFGQIVRLVCQAGYFLIIARALGPQGYGQYIAMSALAAIFAPFSGLGSNTLFVQNVKARNYPPNVCWGNGVLVVFASGTILTLAVLAVDRLFSLRMPYPLLGCLAISDLILYRLTDLATFGFTATHRMTQASVQTAFMSLARLAGVVVLVAVEPAVTLAHWVFTSLVTSAAVTGYAFWQASLAWSKPQLKTTFLLKDIKEGFFFGATEAARSIYNDVDKSMLGRLSNFSAVGIYGAAYRIIDVSMTPIKSIALAAFPEFFQQGEAGLSATYAYAIKLIRRVSIIGIFVSAVLFLGAPVVSRILGAKYREAVPAIQLLAIIPFLRSFHQTLADALSGAGMQKTRLAIQIAIITVNIEANLLVLPRWSWRGAAWTSVGCDVALLFSMWAVVKLRLRREQRSLKANS